jgi:hypothetical protein
VEVNSTAGLAIGKLKPKTIALLDRPSEELIDPDAGLIRFEDWAQARPVEKQFLSPFPSYVEPYSEVTVDGVRKRFKEKLHMYVGEARFVLARPPGSIDLAGLVTLPFVERLDPAIKHSLITSAEAVSPKDPRAINNQHPLRRWCETRPVTICIRSVTVQNCRSASGSPTSSKARRSFGSPAGSRRTHAAPQRSADGARDLTASTRPRSALEQNIFYVNQVMQFGKLLAVFQNHPTGANQTVVTVFMALAVGPASWRRRKSS